MDREWADFDDCVERICDFLGRYGEDPWVRWIREHAAALHAEGPSGAARFTQGWGGMGGFLDLVIHPQNGHPITESDIEPVNQELDDLRLEMYRAAKALGAGSH